MLHPNGDGRPSLDRRTTEPPRMTATRPPRSDRPATSAVRPLPRIAPHGRFWRVWGLIRRDPWGAVMVAMLLAAALAWVLVLLFWRDAISALFWPVAS